MDIIYNINNPRALNLGQQYDHNVRTVTFTGFTPVDDSNTIYLKFEGLGLYPLSNMAFAVSQSFTLKDGTFQGQLFELASDGSLVQNSNTFKMMIKPSLAEDSEIIVNDESISLWFTEMSDLYNEVLEAYEGGMLVNAENIERALGYMPADPTTIPVSTSQLFNDAGFISEVTDDDIEAALGYVPANNADMPTRVSELENDSGYIAEVTMQDVIDAVGYTPANIEDIPSAVSELTNDSGFLTEINSQDVTNALGYIPVNADDMGEYLTNITAEDIANSLGYVPANAENIPVVPEQISAFQNDTGYITGITAEDVIDALGYMPSDADFGNFQPINSLTLSGSSASVIISYDANGEPFSLDGIAVMMMNNNGIQGGTNGYVYIYDADDNVVGGRPVFFYGGSSVSQSVIEIEIRGDVVEMKSIGWTNSAPYSPSNRSLICDARGSGRIAKIEIIGNGQNINSGTSINVLGYALATKTDHDAVVSNSNFELLREITLASSTESVVVTTDSQSNTFELSGVAIILENANGIQGGTNGYINVFDAHDNLIGNNQYFFAGGSSITTSAMMVEIKGEMIEVNSIGWNERSAYSPNNKSVMDEVSNSNSITKIEIIGNGYAISSGTTIKVYGVKI